MKITFLGTGAADWLSPKEDGELRRFSSVLINDDLLIDPGPMVFSASEELNIDISRIKYMINSHDHDDHYCKETVGVFESKGAKFIDFDLKDEKSFGKYTVKTFPANHGTHLGPKHFFIYDGEKRIFYGLDGAWIMYEESCEFKKKHTDLAILDATFSDEFSDLVFEHNNLIMVEELKRVMSNYIDRFVISHMFKGHTSHEKLCKRMNKKDIEVAHDGMVLEI